MEIQINGLITAHMNYPPKDYGKTYAVLDASGWFDDGFFYGCYVQASVQYSAQGGFYPGGSSCPTWKAPPYPGSRPLWVDTVVVRGTGKARRAQGIPYWGSNCGYGACYYYTGEQMVTITPVATTLELAADPADGLAGRTVTYTASASNGSAFTVKEWTFVPDDTSATQVRRVGGGTSRLWTSTVGVLAPARRRDRARVWRRRRRVRRSSRRAGPCTCSRRSSVLINKRKRMYLYRETLSC